MESRCITLRADPFIEKWARIYRRRVARISTPAIELLTSYHGPGNLREPENCISRVVPMARDGVSRGCHLPSTLQAGGSSGTTKSGSPESLRMVCEREVPVESLKNSGGNQGLAVRALSPPPRILSCRLRWPRKGKQADAARAVGQVEPRSNEARHFLEVEDDPPENHLVDVGERDGFESSPGSWMKGKNSHLPSRPGQKFTISITLPSRVREVLAETACSGFSPAVRMQAWLGDSSGQFTGTT